jgi:hypothetical protein
MLMHVVYNFRALSLWVSGRGCWTLHSQPRSACRGMCTLKKEKCPDRRTACSSMCTLHMLVSQQRSFYSITFGNADIYCFDRSNHKVLAPQVARDHKVVHCLNSAVTENKRKSVARVNMCSSSIPRFSSCEV